MRPRVKSYGDISTVTLSPGKMRIVCIRILPETWAVIICPLAVSFTLNTVLGSTSVTTPSHSITSLLARIIPPLLD